MYLLIIGPFVDAISKLRSHEQSLQQTVYVASSAYIWQSFIILLSHFKSNLYYEEQITKKEITDQSITIT